MDKKVVPVAVLVILIVSFVSFYILSPPNEFQTIKAKMEQEAQRLKTEFAVCFENLDSTDLENMRDNEIQLCLENLMPRPNQELLEENIYTIVLNSVGVRVVENLRVVGAEMQYQIWHEKYPEYKISGRIENENVVCLPMR